MKQKRPDLIIIYNCFSCNHHEEKITKRKPKGLFKCSNCNSENGNFKIFNKEFFLKKQEEKKKLSKIKNVENIFEEWNFE